MDDVSLSVAAGQVTCLLGPSGCGKSTTLRIIAGVERADAGEVWLDGVMVAGPREHVPPEVRSVGLMFQDFALFPHLTVAENVGFGCASTGPKRRGGSGNCWKRWIFRVSARSIRMNCPAASSSVSHLRGRWRRAHG